MSSPAHLYCRRLPVFDGQSKRSSFPIKPEWISGFGPLKLGLGPEPVVDRDVQARLWAFFGEGHRRPQAGRTRNGQAGFSIPATPLMC